MHDRKQHEKGDSYYDSQDNQGEAPAQMEAEQLRDSGWETVDLGFPVLLHFNFGRALPHPDPPWHAYMRQERTASELWPGEKANLRMFFLIYQFLLLFFHTTMVEKQNLSKSDLLLWYTHLVLTICFLVIINLYT